MGFANNRGGLRTEPSLMTPTLKGSPFGGAAAKDVGLTGRKAFPVGLFLRPSQERGE